MCRPIQTSGKDATIEIVQRAVGPAFDKESDRVEIMYSDDGVFSVKDDLSPERILDASLYCQTISAGAKLYAISYQGWLVSSVYLVQAGESPEMGVVYEMIVRATGSSFDEELDTVEIIRIDKYFSIKEGDRRVDSLSQPVY